MQNIKTKKAVRKNLRSKDRLYFLKPNYFKKTDDELFWDALEEWSRNLDESRESIKKENDLYEMPEAINI